MFANRRMRETRWAVVAACLVTALMLTLPAMGLVSGAGAPAPEIPSADGDLPEPDPDCSTDIARRLVVGGDGVAYGAKDDSEQIGTLTDRYSDKLLKTLQDEHPGPWCLYNTSDTVDDSDYVIPTTAYRTEGNPTQQSQAHALRPHLIVLTVGRDNDGIRSHVTTCLDKIRDHEFLQANVCALTALNHPTAYTKLKEDLADILGKYKTQMDGNPNLVVAVTGYFNPYNEATKVATKIPGFCADLQDTIPTCTIRWVQLPPALVILDQVVKKLNTTIEGVVDQFETGTQGQYFFVNPYDKFKGHCMQMDVDIKTIVYHPTNTVHNHDSDEDFGCEDDSWIEDDGDTSFASPFIYLTPAVTGVLTLATQTTKHMGYYPNAKGHECIAELVYEAKTDDGLLLKNKLGIPKPANDPTEPCT